MKTSVIIVNYKTDDYVIQCINSLRRHCSRQDFEIIVVDNGAKTSGFSVQLGQLDVRYLDPQDNVGFGRACNLGAAVAIGHRLVFVNPDIVFTGDALALLKEGYDRFGENAIIGLNLIGVDGHPSYAAGRFPSLGVELMELFYAHRWMRSRYATLAVAQTYSDSEETCEVDYVCGALFGISKLAFERLGGFNPAIFLYFEETEMMFRHRQAGGRVHLMCKVTAVHEGSVSTGTDSDFKLSHMEYGRRIFYDTRYGGVTRLLTRVIRGLRLLLMYASKRRRIFVRLLPTALLARQVPPQQ